MGKNDRSQSEPLTKMIKNKIRSKQCSAFFIITILISWSLWITSILIGNIEGHGLSGIESILGTLAAFGPFFGAIIVIKIDGKSVINWLKQIFVWRVKIRWYLAALSIPIIILLITELVYSALGGTVSSEEMSFEILFFLIPMFIMTTTIGGGQEELGWRGFALPKLQETYTAFTASIILGTIHAIWHLPMAFMPGTFQSEGNFLLYILMGIALAVLLTWIYNNTSSVLLPMLFHGMVNTVPFFILLPGFDMETMAIPEIPLLLEISHISVWILFAVVVIAIFGAKRLTKDSEVPVILKE